MSRWTGTGMGMSVRVLFTVGAAAAFLFFAGCGSKGAEKKAFASIADFDGAKVASMAGSVFDEFINRAIPNVTHEYYNTMPDMALAVVSGKADAVALDMPVAKYLVAQNPDLALFPDVVEADRYGFAVAKGSELGVKGNEVLNKMREDGTLAKLEELWFSADESQKNLPVLSHNPEFDGSAGTITYGSEATYPPTCYIGSDGKLTGYEIDIVARIAYELNMKAEFVPMAFAGLLPALASGKVNMVGGTMSITEERLKSVDFIGPNFEGGITLVIRKDRLGK
ncbi:MAG: transporter substrate-binding domain-containing protein [Chitinispirillia bacterium]|nr:transporter substrate-binding domain-containing protein [Chitinispirillia bacterium]MCL2269656.1 transporter substrate-binding domain-containing protein [Chitinispirillia bacterium]